MRRKSTLLASFAAVSIGILTGCDPAGMETGSLAETAGESCSGQTEICLGVNYVTYSDSDGAPIINQETALANIRQVNEVWAQCGIGFQLDEFQVVDPTKYGLSSGAGAANETTEIRAAFDNGRTLLVAQTGFWGTTKNAWAAMPGEAPYGVVLESTVAEDANIVAHELGHYLNLDHTDDASNVLSTIIYPDSVNLTDEQCETARKTATEFWGAMKR